MLAEFSIVPVGLGSSLSKQISEVISLVEKSGLPYRLNPMGTVVEGAWDEIMSLIRQCHDSVIANGERIVTNIRIDDRKGRTGMLDQKILSVEKHLGHKPRT
jgi:uncharacterized protein (TIGR00106 family)